MHKFTFSFVTKIIIADPTTTGDYPGQLLSLRHPKTGAAKNSLIISLSNLLYYYGFVNYSLSHDRLCLNHNDICVSCFILFFVWPLLWNMSMTLSKNLKLGMTENFELSETW